MGTMHEQYVQLYNAVGEPFERIREVLVDGEVASLTAPRRLSMDWLHEGDATLEIEMAGVHLVKEVLFRVSDYIEVPGRLPMGRLQMSWEPTDNTELYPVVNADLEIEPIDRNRTMISLLASYVPPLGRVGRFVDRMAMRNVAQVALGRFFSDLVDDIRTSVLEREAETG
jgi:hypothetical protein